MTVVGFFFRLVFDEFEFFGLSWGVREGILGAPGGSRGHLGRVLGNLGAILERLFEQSDFGSMF